MIDELKKKVEEIKKKEQELDIARQTISITKPLYEVSSSLVQDKVQSNSFEIVREIVNDATEGIKNKLDFSEILEKLDNQAKAIDNKNDKEIIKELQSIILGVQQLSEKTVYNSENLTKLFNISINKITNLLGEIPKETQYKRVKDRISQVVEKYEGYTLTHTWSYNELGELIKVKTTKNETT